MKNHKPSPLFMLMILIMSIIGAIALFGSIVWTGILIKQAGLIH
jgi:hypothetical protein